MGVERRTLGIWLTAHLESGSLSWTRELPKALGRRTDGMLKGQPQTYSIRRVKDNEWSTEIVGDWWTWSSRASVYLNIAHHKSYQPYRHDNIEKIRKDEEDARRKEENEDGRMMLAVSWHDTHVVRLGSKDLFNRALKLVLINYEKSQLYWIKAIPADYLRHLSCPIRDKSQILIRSITRSRHKNGRIVWGPSKNEGLRHLWRWQEHFDGGMPIHVLKFVIIIDGR